MNNYFFLYRCLLVLIASISILGFISCRKSLEDGTKPYEGSRVSFRIIGVNSESSQSKLSTSSKSADLGNSSDGIQFVDNSISENFSLALEQHIENIESPFEGIGMDDAIPKDGAASKVLNKLASISPMPITHKFRVVLIDNNGNVVNTIQESVGQPVNLELEVGKQYTWYAYSYSDTNDIPALTGSETIETPIDRDLLYAKSSAPFTAVSGDNVISILFEHKVAMVSLELDYDRLFAEIPTNSSSSSSVSNNFNWSFNSTPDFLFQGTFSLRTGQVTNHQLYNPDINQILKDHPTAKNIKIAQFYTVAPPSNVTTSSSFGVSLNLLKVRYPNMAVGSVVSLFSSPYSHTFNSQQITTGSKYVAKFKLKYTFPKLNILHVTTTDNIGYAAEPRGLLEGGSTFNASPSANAASFNMIKSERNFGLLDNSVVRTRGFGHRRIKTIYSIDTALITSGAGTPPDIVIMAVNYAFDDGDATALNNYLNQGGVLLLTADGGDNRNFESTKRVVAKIFGSSATLSLNSDFKEGSTYRLMDHNDEILNGPFGDIRKKFWGEDGSITVFMQNFSAADVVVYSDAVPANKSNAVYSNPNMLRHKRKHFFYIGDGGFLCNSLSSGAYGAPNVSGTAWLSSGNYSTHRPFATATAPDMASNKHPYIYPSTLYEHYPVPRPFGYAGNGWPINGVEVYNSTIFANFMSWAIVNATFFGINRGGLGSGSYYEF